MAYGLVGPVSVSRVVIPPGLSGATAYYQASRLPDLAESVQDGTDGELLK